ncbi:hypothetical protein OG331_25275 [Streptomyces sp. NBC_01017]|uniref:hypothetical protein n=1 Tax=Streptomyces sp. NBC_01017 TaxID=2903721 RepID=UPI0038652632|nr:hypothetical protein OG331_25275 [Streptomyces sp. NBC_01017]
MPFELWQPGMIMTEERLASISPTWQDWSPAWTTSTGSATPSFGDASVLARYAQAASVVFFRLEIGFGASTNFGGGGGSDNWRFSLPVASAGTQLIAGSGEAQDSATGGSPSSVRVPLRVRLTSSTVLELETSGGGTGFTGGYSATPTGLIDAVTPFTWANGDFIRVVGQYEAA